AWCCTGSRPGPTGTPNRRTPGRRSSPWALPPSRARWPSLPVDASAGDEVVEVRDVHLHDHGCHTVLADVHGISVRHRRELGHGLLFAHPPPDGVPRVP